MTVRGSDCVYRWMQVDVEGFSTDFVWNPSERFGVWFRSFLFRLTKREQLAKDDVVFEREGAQLVTDDTSLEYLKGATVDYQMEMMRSGFAVLQNPIAESKCGCGTSFSPKV